MLTPGDFTLGDFTITTAGTYTGEWVTDLDGMLACMSSLRFQYGGGGGVDGTVRAYLQTSIPDGTVADVLCAVFGTEPDVDMRNLSATEPMSNPDITDGAMADGSMIQGLLGTQLRLKVVVSGSTPFSGSTLLSGRITVR